jgi:hypothetical protein
MTHFGQPLGQQLLFPAKLGPVVQIVDIAFILRIMCVEYIGYSSQKQEYSTHDMRQIKALFSG